MRYSIQLLVILLFPISASPQVTRARDLGVPFDGEPGPNNAITDVNGVEVGFTTLISGEGETVVGKGPVRTGVTAILPRGKETFDPVFAAWFTLNGNGEMTGTTWIEESGFLEGPFMITNTHSVGVVHDAVIEWLIEKGQLEFDWALPVVAETYDMLNDINGLHVKKEHAFEAINSANSGPVPEGNVGGGTGMICHDFKGGTGTSSRVVGDFRLGVLVQCNYGSRETLRIAGVPVGEELMKPALCWDSPTAPNGEQSFWGVPTCESGRPTASNGQGSIIIVVATDAPLLPHQLKRIVKRTALAVGRMGGMGNNGSGDIFLAFSTANPGAGDPKNPPDLKMLPNETLNPFFRATVAATEEAIVNAMVAAETMTGAYHLRAPALPHDGLREVLERYNRLDQ